MSLVGGRGRVQRVEVVLEDAGVKCYVPASSNTSSQADVTSSVTDDDDD